ncbi:hypothetical protein [Providencia alcalifaciens]|uniref:hypothetical protein n=1 Tax=Providencia alcalifaciens TaxID=126385 RepID=UPI000D37E2B1|nr:hypothetical protein [Providencia alcalifaciens]
MNNEILELAEGLEVIADVLIKDGQTHKQIELKTLVKLCEYIKKINKLQPVAWMYPVFHDDKMQFTTDSVTSENIDIYFQSHGSPFKVTPLYRLDK